MFKYEPACCGFGFSFQLIRLIASSYAYATFPLVNGICTKDLQKICVDLICKNPIIPPQTSAYTYWTDDHIINDMNTNNGSLRIFL